jgi:hypothetical protein
MLSAGGGGSFKGPLQQERHPERSTVGAQSKDPGDFVSTDVV